MCNTHCNKKYARHISLCYFCSTSITVACVETFLISFQCRKELRLTAFNSNCMTIVFNLSILKCTIRNSFAKTWVCKVLCVYAGLHFLIKKLVLKSCFLFFILLNAVCFFLSKACKLLFTESV